MFVNRIWRRVVLAAALLLGVAVGARAATEVDCTSNSAALATMAGNGTLSGEVQINGTCIGNVVLFTAGVTLDKFPSSGASIQIQGSVSITAPNITLSGIVIDGTGASAQGVQIFGNVTGIILNAVTVQNFPASGVTAGGAATVFIEGGEIAGNTNCGLFVFNGAQVELDSSVVITGNGAGTSSSLQCGIDVEDGAGLFITAANVHDNANGPALRIFQATGDLTGGTFQAPSPGTYPAVTLERATLNLSGVTITGTGHSSALWASPGSVIKMHGTSIANADASDPTVFIADSSTLLSTGGNIICAGTLSGQSCTPTTNGPAITVANGSVFQERNESALNTPIAADAFTGSGTIQMQSSMEIGTGGSAPSTWTTGNNGVIVTQNSAFRMDGGMTITAEVKLTQGSNGFFNTAAGGQNIVENYVTCPSGTQNGDSSTSHIAGPTFVLLSPGGATATEEGGTTIGCNPF